MNEQHDRMGQYIQDYKPRTNIHSIINGFVGPRYAFSSDQTFILTGSKEFPDVSFYQELIEWDKMRSKTDTVCIRVGQNLWEDPQFDRNYYQAKIRAMLRGLYYFYDDRVTPQAQADKFHSIVGGDIPEMEIWADWENSYGGGYGGLPNVVKFMKALQIYYPTSTIGEYTGYYWHRDHSNWVTNAAEYAYLKNHPLWLAWYTNNPAYVLIPAPYTDLLLWQYGTPPEGIAHGCKTIELDKDKVNLTDAAFYQRYSAAPPPPVKSDFISYPFPGVKYITGTRFGRKFYLTICDPSKVRFEVAHADSPDLLDYPSAVGKRKGARLAWNGGEWNKHAEPYKPSDLSISNGLTYVPRTEFVPSLIFFQNGLVTIDHVNIAGQYNVCSGLRYLIENGVMKAYLNDELIQYIERRARSIEGLDRNGHVMRLTVDGVYPAEGVQLKEAAALMLEFGAVVAFDTSGGGDSTLAINGITQNIPEDIWDGKNVERRVPEFLLAYTQEESTEMIYTVKSNVASETRAVRRGPGILFSSVANLPAGATATGDFKYTYTATLTTDGLTRANIGDKWVHVKVTIAGVMYDGWMAEVHLAKVYTIVTETPPAPPPVPETIASVFTSQEIVVARSNGLVETYRKENIELPKV